MRKFPVYHFYLLCIVEVNWLSEQFNPITDFRQLQRIEDDVRQTTLELFHQHINWTKNMNDGYRYRANIAGSLREGAFLARFFKQNTDKVEDIYRSIDVDVQFTIAHISKQQRHCIEASEEKPGFLRYHARKRGWNFPRASVAEEEYERLVHLNGYIKPNSIKRIYFLYNSVQNHTSILDVLKLVVAYIFKLPLDEIKLYNVNEEITKATSTLSIRMIVGENKEFKLGLDNAFILRTSWMPGIIKDWVDRERNWTNLVSNLREELETGYIILKSSNEEKSNLETTELRYSFAHLERKIVALQSKVQKLVYFIFKSMIYRRLLKNHLEDIVSSYIGKTVTLWTCEKYPPDDPFWDDSDQAITKILAYLLNELFKGSDKGFLPYYFIPRINVIGHLPSHVINKIRDKLNVMRKNVDHYLIIDTRLVVRFSEEYLNIVNTHKKLAHILITNQLHSPEVYKLLSQRPDIFLRILTNYF